MAGETLQLPRGESVTIVSSTPEALTVEATYERSDRPPPMHSHPAQDESFEVLEGSIHVRYGGERAELAKGEKLEVPEGMAHQMWNPSAVPARVRWTTTPRGRTEDWFRAIDALVAESAPREPSALGFAVLLSDFGDTFRLQVAPYLLMLPVLKVLGGVGRLTGHRVGGKPEVTSGK
jgi:mannose-6-phosphate isomerase-like protein (cupin superfamily)